ncbi:unnamed protein product [Laminaria digitata]
MFVASLAAIATACGAFWGLGKTDIGLTNIEDRTQSIATDLQAILSMPNDTMVVLRRVTRDYNATIASFRNCTESGLLPPSATIRDTGLTSLTDDVLEEFEQLNSESMSKLADDVQGVSDAVADTEGVRKGVVWPALTLAMLFTAAFVVVAIGTYECIACGTSTCGAVSCVVAPCTVFLAIVIWISAASAVTLSALSGDFCTDPDTNVETLIAESSNDETLRSLLTYYTGDCTSENFAVDAILGAQETALPIIQETLPVLYSVTSFCESLLPPVDAVNASLYSLWSVLDEAGQLSSCENLNGPYQAAVYEELCDELPRGLLGFWVSCVILTLLLLVLAVQWNRLLLRQLTEEDAQLAEERARNRPAWMPKLLSRRSFSSLTGSSSSRHASLTSRHDMTDSRRVHPASNPLPDECRGEEVSAPASGSDVTAVQQRPVKIANRTCDMTI